LIMLLGMTYVQSLGIFQWAIGGQANDIFYTTLLLVESVAAIGWGVRVHSRGYVQIGGLALLVNALTQLGPAFVNLPRWIQLGSIGIILLVGGLLALYQREHLIAARRSLTGAWKRWEP
jgi:hypothetical protein